MEEIGGKNAFPLEDLIVHEIAPILVLLQAIHLYAHNPDRLLYFAQFKIFSHCVLLIYEKRNFFLENFY